jgi:hypothetical protein
MSRKIVKRKNRIEQESPWLLRFLATGKIPKPEEDGALKCWEMRGKEEYIKKAWIKNRALISSDWIARKPGTRPWSWWRFDAPRWEREFNAWFNGTMPEPRKRLGGTGTPDYEHLSIVPRFEYGIPIGYVDAWLVEYYNGRAKDIHGELIPCKYKDGNFKGIAIDYDDPPVFETEASYLKRHGLLTKSEEKRLKPEDFEPKTLFEYLPHLLDED